PVTGWYSQKYTDSTGKERTRWRYINSDGTEYKGWLNYGGKWYYVQNSYVCQGTVMTIDGATYGFAEDGHMVTGWFKQTWSYMDNGNIVEYIEWYNFDSNGKGHNGWLKDGDKWCYCRNGYAYRNGSYDINGVVYRFDSSCHMVTGWYKQVWTDSSSVEHVEWYYLDADGKGHNGWVKDGNYWCYCENGYLYKDDYRYINGYNYAFDSNGHMITGWYYVSYNDEWMYFGSSGKAYTGIASDSNHKYYCENGHIRKYGTVWVNGVQYSCDEETGYLTELPDED
ncbi:MAG: hypothetical protein Q4D71_02255, partial [Oscillospiraceae bacterium]|nr:hypothetical protein [Oscillospiraceae bacterium]